MGKKYIDSVTYNAGRTAESKKKSNGVFFSSKEDNDENFNKFTGEELRVVGVAHVGKNKDSEIDAYNVVCFDDGHQLSTSRFFTARGLKWPVGGNTAKWDYLNACLANDTKISVTVDKVVVGEERTTNDGRKFNPVTYYFEPMELPKTDMSVLADLIQKEEA